MCTIYHCQIFIGSNVAKVLTEKIPCTVVSMAFFDKLLDANNNIVCNGRGSPDDTGDHQIRQCMEVQKNGKYIVNNLQMVILYLRVYYKAVARKQLRGSVSVGRLSDAA